MSCTTFTINMCDNMEFGIATDQTEDHDGVIGAKIARQSCADEHAQDCRYCCHRYERPADRHEGPALRLIASMRSLEVVELHGCEVDSVSSRPLTGVG